MRSMLSVVKLLFTVYYTFMNHPQTTWVISQNEHFFSECQEIKRRIASKSHTKQINSQIDRNTKLKTLSVHTR